MNLELPFTLEPDNEAARVLNVDGEPFPIRITKFKDGRIFVETWAPRSDPTDPDRGGWSYHL